MKIQGSKVLDKLQISRNNGEYILILFAFSLSLFVIFDGCLVSYHGHANNITYHLVNNYIKLLNFGLFSL